MTYTERKARRRVRDDLRRARHALWRPDWHGWHERACDALSRARRHLRPLTSGEAGLEADARLLEVLQNLRTSADAAARRKSVTRIETVLVAMGGQV